MAQFRFLAAGIVLFGSILSMTGCAMIHGTTLSDFASGQGQRIRAIDTADGFFMVSIPELDAATKLKAQCAGSITGVQTMTWMRNWIVVQHYRQEATGWCQNPIFNR